MPPPPEVQHNKRPADDDAGGQHKKAKLEPAEPFPMENPLSFFKARVSYRAPRHNRNQVRFSHDILYLPAAKNPLFDALGIHDNNLYLYQIFNRKGRGEGDMAVHGMADRGLEQVKSYLPGPAENYHIIFTAVVPKGSKARLVVCDENKEAFRNFTFMALEIDIKSLDVLLSYYNLKAAALPSNLYQVHVTRQQFEQSCSESRRGIYNLSPPLARTFLRFSSPTVAAAKKLCARMPDRSRRPPLATTNKRALRGPSAMTAYGSAQGWCPGA
ncbi:hypothetical protein FB451DRAFT_1549140 [Mycena latifolia]|nr:hypothetical protein FB451DRAFT_1549140 [Mycena latifolia]